MCCWCLSREKTATSVGGVGPTIVEVWPAMRRTSWPSVEHQRARAHPCAPTHALIPQRAQSSLTTVHPCTSIDPQSTEPQSKEHLGPSISAAIWPFRLLHSPSLSLILRTMGGPQGGDPARSESASPSDAPPGPRSIRPASPQSRWLSLVTELIRIKLRINQTIMDGSFSLVGEISLHEPPWILDSDPSESSETDPWWPPWSSEGEVPKPLRD